MTRDADLAKALSRLENLLRRSGAAITPVLRAGIGAPEVVRLLGEVGLAPTLEVVTWFGWHDGAGLPGISSLVIELVPGGEFYELAHLCGEYVSTRAIAVELAAMPDAPFDANQTWPATWFPLLRLFGKGFLAVDLAGPEGSLSPVHIVWHDEEPSRSARVAWPSIGAFVETVIGRFEEGVYSIDGEGIVQGPTLDFPGE